MNIIILLNSYRIGLGWNGSLHHGRKYLQFLQTIFFQYYYIFTAEMPH